MDEQKQINFKELYDRFFDPKNTRHLYYTWAGKNRYQYFYKVLDKKKYQKLMEQRKQVMKRQYQKKRLRDS